MKLRDGGATIMIVIAIVCFGDWILSSAEPKQCWEEVKTSENVTVGQWRDCTKQELTRP